MHLRDVGRLISGQHVLAENVNNENRGVPYLTGPSDFGGDTPQAKHWTTQGTAFAEPGDILVTVKGSGCGSMAIADQRYAISRQLMAVRPTACDGRFLWVALLREVDRLNAQSAGTIPGLTRSQILDLPIPNVSRTSQIIVGRIESAYRRQLANLAALIEKKRKRKAGLMWKVFSESSWAETDGFSWRELSLEEITRHIETGVSVRSLDRPAIGGEKGVLKTSALNDGRFDATANKVVRIEELSRVRVSPTAGCTLVSRMNTLALVGESAYVTQDYPDLVLPDRIWQLHPRTEVVDPRWLGFLIASNSVRCRLREVASGTSGSMKNISQKQLLSVRVRVPSREIQDRVARLLVAVEREEESLRSLRVNYERQKRAVMQRLLSGDIPDLDPAA